jgi:hypothetical protein
MKKQKKTKFKAWNDEDRKKFLEFIESDEYKNFILKMKIFEVLKDVVPNIKKDVVPKSQRKKDRIFGIGKW